jgi:CDP-diacylglycerol--serine O-phosphatidyltransferase
MLPFIILALVAVVVAFISGWLAVPVTFIAYVILSLLVNRK